jgi:hypothetical protein
MRPASTLPTAKSGTGFKMALSPQGKVRHTVGSDFHFSQPPTVTTGFIAFSFDIRKYSK